MNQMKELEQQLPLWAPRRPSARLEQRLFGHSPAARAADQPPFLLPVLRAFHLRWLAPMTMALLLVCVLFGQHNSQTLFHSVSSNAIVAVALSNQSAPWSSGSASRAQQGPNGETLEWTNAGGSTSSVPLSFGSERESNNE
jgi:hypothetical protein